MRTSRATAVAKMAIDSCWSLPRYPLGAATVRERLPALKTAASRQALTSKRIPDSRAEIVETGRARTFDIEQVHAAQQTGGYVHRRRHPRRAKTRPRPGFHEIGPHLPLGVDGEIHVPEELGAQRRPPHRVAGARLVVHQKVVAEPADENAVVGRVREPAGGFRTERPANRMRI